MENKQNSSQSNQFSNQSSQSNQPNANQSSQSSSRSQSSQPTSSSTGSSIGSQQSSRSGSGSNMNSNSNSGSSSSKIGGIDMNTVTSKLQEYGTTAMNKVNSLSTTQKVVGGSLLALGAGWLAMNRNKSGKNKTNLNTTRSNKFGRSSS
ncbi:hypothetical protein [Pontibacter pudoricolor]|uniref:hypothetical protein n=1 Tax=Pontibacter pudoricolor TaxID=2694930 RepID=UPI0013911424|nr:hypothetical protein [Pontibacter pudoricolor]